ncbi:MAG: hypothetical protein Q4P08_00905 [Eubacteriales bacterium]|nr:hypothetical protein [Eubacteriales bacterium]
MSWLKKLERKEASIVLELALAIPIFLFAAYFMISAILAQRQALVLRHALEQTANELEVLLPLVEDGAALLFGEAQVAELIAEILPENPGLLESAALDLASSELLGTFLQARVDYWAQATASQLQLRLAEHNRQILLSWRDGGQSLLMTLYYELTTPWTKHEQRSSAYVPLWLSTSAEGGSEDSDSEDRDNIWSESNFTRGREFRAAYGANLPFNTPVIAYYAAGHAKAIRSLDLTAPSYQDKAQASEQILYEIKRLAKYQGGKIPGARELKAEQIQRRELLLIIPENSPAEYSEEFWQAQKSLAAQYGVELKLVRDQNSYRYAD